MWWRIKRALIAFTWTVGGFVAFLALMGFLIDYSADLQHQLAIDQAHLDVMVAREIYEANMTTHMELCTGLGAPTEMCLGLWVSRGQ